MLALRRRVLCLALVSASTLIAGCGTQMVNPVTGQTERTVMDERAEIAEGRKAHEQVLKEYGRYDNPALQAYVNDIGQKLAARSHRAHLTWTLPFGVLIMFAVFNRFSPSYEEAARDLGASPWRTFRKVTLPLIVPGIVAAALLSFALSMDDYIITDDA